MTMSQLEHRVSSLEHKVAAMAGQAVASTLPNVNAWIDEIHGTFNNNATYRQAARLGRQWRKSHRPAAPRARKTAAV